MKIELNVPSKEQFFQRAQKVTGDVMQVASVAGTVLGGAMAPLYLFYFMPAFSKSSLYRSCIFPLFTRIEYLWGATAAVALCHDALEARNKPVADEMRGLESQEDKKESVSYTSQAIQGMKAGVTSFTRSLLYLLPINAICNQIFDTTNASFSLEPFFYDAVIRAPIREELVFRGAIQSAFEQIQTFLIKPHLPESHQSRLYKWLQSPLMPAFATNLLFAPAHLRNAGGYLSTAGAVAQCTHLLFNNSFGPLRAQTDGVTAPIFAHIAHGALACLCVKLFESS